MGNNITVRAQRVVFQLWKVDVPWATAGTVTVALGGDIAKDAGILPDQSALQPEAPVGASLGGAKQTRGLFAITSHDVPFQPSTFTNPAVDGVVIRTFWKDVEPAANQFDWSFVDGQVNQASAAGKKVIVMVLPGAFTPNWALQSVQTAQFDAKYGFAAGQAYTQPIPWDQNYLNQWFTFIRAFGQRYDANPSVVMVPMAGPTSTSAEMSLPNGPDAIAQWQQLGYSPDKYEAAWAQTVSAYAQAFPTTQIGLALYPGLPIPDVSASDQTRLVITSSALAAYGRKVTIQSSGLSARKEAAPRLGYQLVQQYAGTTTVGFEMGTSATRKPDRMGGTDPVSALRSTIDFGLQAKPNFLEIYEPDIDNVAMQDTLAYAHTALGQ
jgi:hypothetical protein